MPKGNINPCFLARASFASHALRGEHLKGTSIGMMLLTDGQLHKTCLRLRTKLVQSDLVTNLVRVSLNQSVSQNLCILRLRAGRTYTNIQNDLDPIFDEEG